MSTARTARACTVYLTQNLPSYYAQIGGRNPEHIADSLLGNFQTKIFHANGDPKSNQWAADLIGKSVQYRRTYGEGERYGESSGTTYGASENVGVSDTQGTNTSQQRNKGWGGGWSSSSQPGGGTWNNHYNYGQSAGTGTNESTGTTRGRGWNWGTNRGKSRDRSHNLGVNEVIDYELQPAEFSRLRKGGPEHSLQVDEPASNGGEDLGRDRVTTVDRVHPIELRRELLERGVGQLLDLAQRVALRHQFLRRLEGEHGDLLLLAAAHASLDHVCHASATTSAVWLRSLFHTLLVATFASFEALDDVSAWAFTQF